MVRTSNHWGKYIQSYTVYQWLSTRLVIPFMVLSPHPIGPLWCHVLLWDLVNTGSDNGLSDSTKLLPEVIYLESHHNLSGSNALLGNYVLIRWDDWLNPARSILPHYWHHRIFMLVGPFLQMCICLGYLSCWLLWYFRHSWLQCSVITHWQTDNGVACLSWGMSCIFINSSLQVAAHCIFVIIYMNINSWMKIPFN